MTENTLFNDSDTFTKERPIAITAKQEVQLLREIAEEIKQEGYSNSSIDYIVADLEKINFNDSGFEIAKKLEYANAYYEIDSQLIEFLENLSHRKGEILEENVKAWVKAHKPKPLFPAASKLIINTYLCHGFKVGETVFINRIDTERAVYIVDKDPNRKGGVVLEYERVEKSCSIQND